MYIAAALTVIIMNYQEAHVVTPIEHYPPPPFNDYSDLKNFLATEHFWPNGLQDILIKSAVKFPVRFMIVDDSGSMAISDGHKLEKTKTSSLV